MHDNREVVVTKIDRSIGHLTYEEGPYAIVLYCIAASNLRYACGWSLDKHQCSTGQHPCCVTGIEATRIGLTHLLVLQRRRNEM
jgi:hypothetical protein